MEVGTVHRNFRVSQTAQQIVLRMSVSITLATGNDCYLRQDFTQERISSGIVTTVMPNLQKIRF